MWYETFPFSARRIQDHVATRGKKLRLYTGGTSGIGPRMAEVFVADGAKL
jgi:hypothetical protein